MTNHTDVEEIKRRLAIAESIIRADNGNFHRSLIDSGMAYWEWDLDTDEVRHKGAIAAFNAGSGKPEGPNLERRYSHLHVDDREAHIRKVEAARQTGTGWHAELRVIDPVRKCMRWIEERAAPSNDPVTGKPRMVGFVWDITDRKQQEIERDAALRESEARHRLVVETWAQAVWVTDPAGVVINDSASWRAYTGQTFEEWLGYGWIDAIHPEDCAFAERQWREAIAARGVVNAEFRLRAPDGGWRWTNVCAAPVIDKYRNIEKWVGINLAIDDRKRAEISLRLSEERYQTLVNSIDEGFCIIEMLFDLVGQPVDYRFLELNPAFEQQARFIVAPGVRILEVAPNHEKIWFETYGRVALTGQPERFEHWSEEFKVFYDVYAFQIDAPNLRRVAVLFRDVTKRKHEQAHLLQSEKKQTFLLELNDLFRVLTTVSEIETTAVEAFGKHIGASAVFLATMNEDGERWSVNYGYANGPSKFAGIFPLSDFQKRQLPKWKLGIVSHVADSEAEPYFDALDRAAYAAFGARASIGVPLVRGGRFAALLAINQASPRQWTEIEIALARETAERTWAEMERARIAVALRESEARLAAAFEGVPVGAAVLDSSGRIVTANPEFQRFLPSGFMPSVDPAGVARWRAWDAQGQTVPPHEFPGARALKGERVVPGMEMLFTQDDGRDVWTRVACVPIHDNSGNVLGHVSTISDIDAARRSAEALKASEEKLRAFGEASQDILWIRDAQTLEWTYLTPAFENIYGVGRQVVQQGHNYNNWLELILTEDRAHVHAMVNRVLSGEQITFDYRIRRPEDGGVRWIRDTSFPMRDQHGRVVRFGGIGQDTTALKEAADRLTTSEERLQSAAEVAKFALWDWDLQTDIVFWSDEHFRMEGYQVGEIQPSYEAWASRVHKDDLNNTLMAIQYARDNRTEYNHEFRTVHPDGSVHWHSARARFFYNESGTALRMIGAMLDTTTRREWEERQKVLVAELQHRTRNLMAVVSSMADKTARTSPDLPSFRTRFDERLKALARVQSLLSRLDDHDRVTFDELIRTELDAMNSYPERIALSGPIGIRLRSSTVQTLALALHELATNAVKYGALGQSEGRLAVAWSLEFEGVNGDRWLHITWCESGVDMPSSGAPPTGTGQGRELIERALPYQLGARVDYRLAKDGVQCMISMPVSVTKPKI